MLWELLADFVFRLSFGIVLAMLLVPTAHVSSGFFKVNMWVLLGLNTFAALAIQGGDWSNNLLLPAAILAAVFSYIGSVLWMYDSKRWGTLALYAVLLFDLLGASFLKSAGATYDPDRFINLSTLNVFSSGALLGITMVAMLLGHWYLNVPGMKLEPLQKLVLFMLFSVVLRSLICGYGLYSEIQLESELNSGWYGLVTLRWLSGLVGTACMGLMTWQTLKIPNTQSATGILYVAVIFSFLGELSSQLLVSTATYPL